MNQQTGPLILMIVFIGIMYFLMIRPQKKRERAVNDMRNAIKVGDDVITIGGICGKIVKTKDDVLTIQVGADKTKFEVMRWAISKVVTDEPASSSKKTKKEEPAPQEEPAKKILPKKLGKKADEAPMDEVPADETPAKIAVEEPAEPIEAAEPSEEVKN